MRSEERDPRTREIDLWPPSEILRMINRENARWPALWRGSSIPPCSSVRPNAPRRWTRRDVEAEALVVSGRDIHGRLHVVAPVCTFRGGTTTKGVLYGYSA